MKPAVLVCQKKIEFYSYATVVVFGAVGAKANVLQSVGFVRLVAALLILLKRWHFIFHFSVRLLSVVSSFRVRHNVCIVEYTNL